MEAQQLNFTLKTRTHKQFTKVDKRWLRQLVSEGKTTKQISEITGWSMGRIQKARAYHIKRVRKANPVKRAKTADLTQELMRRGNTVTLGDKLAWAALAIVVLTVVISFARM